MNEKAILVFNAYETLKELYGKKVMITISVPVESKNGKIKGYQYHSTEEAILKPMPLKNENSMNKIKVIDCVTFSAEAYNQAKMQIEQRVHYDVNRLMAKGFDNCIDEILGETDNE